MSAIRLVASIAVILLLAGSVITAFVLYEGRSDGCRVGILRRPIQLENAPFEMINPPFFGPRIMFLKHCRGGYPVRADPNDNLAEIDRLTEGSGGMDTAVSGYLDGHIIYDDEWQASKVVIDRVSNLRRQGKAELDRINDRYHERGGDEIIPRDNERPPMMH